jgi:hypothetical protein
MITLLNKNHPDLSGYRFFSTSLLQQKKSRKRATGGNINI